MVNQLSKPLQIHFLSTDLSMNPLIVSALGKYYMASMKRGNEELNAAVFTFLTYSLGGVHFMVPL